MDWSAIFVWSMSILGFLSICQPTKARTYAACVFTIAPVSHGWIFGAADGPAYFLSGMALSLLTIILLSGIRPTVRLVVSLQKVCLAFIAADCIGLAMWYAYLPPDLNLAVSYALYLIAAVSMLKWDREDVRNTDSWLDCVRRYADIWRSHHRHH